MTTRRTRYPLMSFLLTVAVIVALSGAVHAQTQPPPVPSPLCTPLVMNMETFDHSGSVQNWFVRVGDSGTVRLTLSAVAVNTVEEGGSIIATVFDGPASVASATVPLPSGPGASPGDANHADLVFGGPAGSVRRLEVRVGDPPPGLRAGRHYQFRTEGARAAWTASPGPQNFEAPPTRWGLQVAPGEGLVVRATAGNIFPAPPQGEFTLVDPLGNIALHTTLTEASPGAGFDGLLQVPNAVGGRWTLVVGALPGHYVLDKQSTPDRNIYLTPCPPPLPPPPPKALRLRVDVKPASDPNAISLKRNGVVSVAIFTVTPDGAGDALDPFDATQADPGNVRMIDAADLQPGIGPAGATPVRWALEDVDGDGHQDLVLKFRMQDLVEHGGFDSSTENAIVFGPLPTPASGRDAIKIVPNQ